MLIILYSNLKATSNQVYGQVFAPNFSGNTSATLSQAAKDINNAYLRAMLESPASYSEYAAGALAGASLQPGMYVKFLLFRQFLARSTDTFNL